MGDRRIASAPSVVNWVHAVFEVTWEVIASFVENDWLSGGLLAGVGHDRGLYEALAAGVTSIRLGGILVQGLSRSESLQTMMDRIEGTGGRDLGIRVFKEGIAASAEVLQRAMTA